MTLLINPPPLQAEVRNLARKTVMEMMGKQLYDLGVRPHGALLVHSSLSALGYVQGGAETVIQGLLHAVGPGGTLLLPALSYEYVTSRNPVFDVRRTASCVGLIPEAFRTRPSTMRSIHPTHSVCAYGGYAQEMLADHVLDTTPVGPHSPFRKLRDLKGQILMLGCGLEPNTSMHGIEELAPPPYLFRKEPITYLLIYPDGRPVSKAYIAHNFRGWIQRYDRIADYLDAPALRRGRVLEAEAHLIEAEALWTTALQVLQKDPFAFVDRDPKAAPFDDTI